MGEIQFDTARLSECKSKIDNLTKALQEYADEALALISSLGYSEQIDLLPLVKEIIEINEEIIYMAGKLERLAGLYVDCERSVEDVVKRLFTAIRFANEQVSTLNPASASASSAPVYTPSFTMPKGVYVEGWIMELMYTEQSNTANGLWKESD